MKYLGIPEDLFDTANDYAPKITLGSLDYDKELHRIFTHLRDIGISKSGIEYRVTRDEAAHLGLTMKMLEYAGYYLLKVTGKDDGVKYSLESLPFLFKTIRGKNGEPDEISIKMGFSIID